LLAERGIEVDEQYDNNPIESDHGRLKSRLRPMRGLKSLHLVAG
jgi:transposase-like protein